MTKIIYSQTQFFKNCLIFAKRPGGSLKYGDSLFIALATGACVVLSGLGVSSGETPRLFLVNFLIQNSKRLSINTVATQAPTIKPFTSKWVTLVTSDIVTFEQSFGSTSVPADITPPRLISPPELMFIFLCLYFLFEDELGIAPNLI